MNYRKAAKDEYKKSSPRRGVYIIHNLKNNKLFVGSAFNVDARLNRSRFELTQGVHKNAELQHDFTAIGEKNFSFEVADVLEEKNEQKVDLSKELQQLELMWLEKVQPFGERGYNGRTAPV